MTIFLLSLGGFPPMAGFIAKWYVFSAAVQGRLHLARDHRRADQRRLGLLLPARRRDDVHDADRGAARVPRGAAHRRRRAGRVGDPDRSISAILPDARPRLGRGVDLAVFLEAVLRRRQVDPAAGPAYLHRARP